VQIGSVRISSADQWNVPDFPRIVDCLSPQILDQILQFLPLTAEGDVAPILALDEETLGVMPCSVR
jgi:hypothetical protein